MAARQTKDATTEPPWELLLRHFAPLETNTLAWWVCWLLPFCWDGDDAAVIVDGDPCCHHHNAQCRAQFREWPPLQATIAVAVIVGCSFYAAESGLVECDDTGAAIVDGDPHHHHRYSQFQAQFLCCGSGRGGAMILERWRRWQSTSPSSWMGSVAAANNRFVCWRGSWIEQLVAPGK